MEKKWITTEQVLEALKNDPNNEHEYDLLIAGGSLMSTHLFYFDSEKNLFGHTTNCQNDWFSESELLEFYGGCHWVRFA